MLRDATQFQIGKLRSEYFWARARRASSDPGDLGRSVLLQWSAGSVIRAQINVGHTFGGVTFSFLWSHYHSPPLGEGKRLIQMVLRILSEATEKKNFGHAETMQCCALLSSCLGPGTSAWDTSSDVILVFIVAEG
jgi:hypothetical protein